MLSEQKRIFQMLVDEATKPSVGLTPVKAACAQFIRMGLRATAQSDRRKPIPRTLVEAAWKRQGGRCVICKKPLALDEAVGDHVDPHGLGGEHSNRNIVAVHGSKSEVNCNSVKGGRDVIAESKRRGELLTDMFPSEEELLKEESLKEEVGDG